MLQDEIIKIGEFFRGIEYFNNALMVKVQFPLGWVVYPNAVNTIKPAQSEGVRGEYYYYGDMNVVTLDEVFALVEETIQANQDAEKKVELLNQKSHELKEIFSKTPYERLINLKFVFDEPKKEEKPKRKYNRKKKVEEQKEVTVEEVNIEDNSEEQEKTE